MTPRPSHGQILSVFNYSSSVTSDTEREGDGAHMRRLAAMVTSPVHYGLPGRDGLQRGDDISVARHGDS